jgi:hypothetical protein
MNNVEWKGINCKQSTRWQHLSWLKASAFFSLQIFLVVMKHNNLYLGLVLPLVGDRASLIQIGNYLQKILKFASWIKFGLGWEEWP